MVRKLSLLLITAIALMLAACGGGGGTTTNNTSSSALSETYDAGGLSFKYPSGWVVQAPDADVPGGAVMLGNSQTTLNAMTADGSTKAESGQQAIMIIPVVGDAFTAMSAAVSSPVDLLKMMGPSMSAGANGLTFGDPTEATVGGNPAAKASGTSDSGDGKLIAIKVGDAGYVLVMGVTAKGEMGNLESTVDGLAETVTVKAS
jgi:hypothetical protein